MLDSLAIKGLTFRSKNPTQSAIEMEAILKGAEIKSKYTLYNSYKMLDENRNYIFIANVFSYTFIIMIPLIAVANVFNTISTNIKLRRRELAILRSVGMSERDFQKMMNFECAFYGMRALLFVLPIATISSWLIYKWMVAGGADNIDFVFPWGSIGISVFSVRFVVFIRMLYATIKIKRENIIDVLRDDIT
ncbi:MAG: ABC transporter permease [Clostridiaceae bacterium]|nr:ABC transporter permease [Clostridiaceae bacterium]